MTDTVPTNEVLARLGEVPFLRGLPGHVLDTIRRGGTVRRYPRGELLFQRGEAAKGLFVVLRGSVRVYQIADTGREHILTVERPGNSVAELPLFDEGPYPASAEAAEDSVLFTLGRERFAALLREYPEVAHRVIAALAQRLRRLVQTVEELALKEVRQRVAAMLLRLAEQHGPEFTLPTSNEQLAAQLGTVREVVSRAINGFAHDGLIELEGRQVRILDLKELRERA
ncbi:MAG: Crp/Fnr family transcriptional regulator [Armatimonadetes bacterium]|nr:Crp/Fnr family transcriptional regulator [Armatimonadota bacterium]